MIHPAGTSDDMVLPLDRTGRILFSTTGGWRIDRVRVVNPLGDVASEVMEPEGIRIEAANRRGCREPIIVIRQGTAEDPPGRCVTIIAGTLGNREFISPDVLSLGRFPCHPSCEGPFGLGG